MERRYEARIAHCFVVLLCLGLAACAGPSAPPAKRPPHCPSPTAHSPRQLAIFPQHDSMRGVVDVAWAPDGACLAILGSLQSSATSQVSVSVLNVYDAYAGKMLVQLRPDDFVLPAIGNQVRGQNANITYQSVLWSPDGGRLAIPFTVSSAQYQPLFTGLLLTDLSGAHASVLARPDPPGASLSQPAGPPLAEWDVSHGAPLALATLPAALDYHWGVTGALVADTPLNPRTAPAGALSLVGNPDGGAAFTVWQPGTARLQVASAQPNSPVELPGAYVWTTTFAAWSPDGRYIADGIATTGRMQPVGHPTPTQHALLDFGLDAAPLLPVHDAGLLAVLYTMHTSGSDGTDAVSIAWRPDGRYLAARVYYVSPGDGLDHTIGLYDGATGARIASLAPFAAPDASGNLGYALRWSPDGTRLLIVSYDETMKEGVVTVLGPGVVPT